MYDAFVEMDNTYNVILRLFFVSGFYCEGPGETSYIRYECPTGYYCPQATTFATAFPCPGRSYNLLYSNISN